MVTLDFHQITKMYGLELTRIGVENFVQSGIHFLLEDVVTLDFDELLLGVRKFLGPINHTIHYGQMVHLMDHGRFWCNRFIEASAIFQLCTQILKVGNGFRTLKFYP